MITNELVMLHRLVLSDIDTIAHFRTHGSLIHPSVRTDIYNTTGFERLEPTDSNAERAREILRGPLYRMLWRSNVNGPFVKTWLPLGKAGSLYDSGHLDVQFGQLVLENGEIRPMTTKEQAAISDAADRHSASK